MFFFLSLFILNTLCVELYIMDSCVCVLTFDYYFFTNISSIFFGLIFFQYARLITQKVQLLLLLNLYKQHRYAIEATHDRVNIFFVFFYIFLVIMTFPISFHTDIYSIVTFYKIRDCCQLFLLLLLLFKFSFFHLVRLLMN